MLLPKYELFAFFELICNVPDIYTSRALFVMQITIPLKRLLIGVENSFTPTVNNRQRRNDHVATTVCQKHIVQPITIGRKAVGRIQHTIASIITDTN